MWARFCYHVDFIVCPPLIAFFAFCAWRDSVGWNHVGSSLWFLNGVLGWTLIEYVFHRWMLHHAPLFKPAHMAHHDAPDELIASPPGLVPLALAGFGQIAMYGASPGSAAGFTAGMVSAYLFYSFVHWATHRLSHSTSAYMIRARRRHLLHHYAGQEANYGVTTDFWDRVFATGFASKVSRS